MEAGVQNGGRCSAASHVVYEVVGVSDILAGLLAPAETIALGVRPVLSVAQTNRSVSAAMAAASSNGGGGRAGGGSGGDHVGGSYSGSTTEPTGLRSQCGRSTPVDSFASPAAGTCWQWRRLLRRRLVGGGRTWHCAKFWSTFSWKPKMSTKLRTTARVLQNAAKRLQPQKHPIRLLRPHGQHGSATGTRATTVLPLLLLLLLLQPLLLLLQLQPLLLLLLMTLLLLILLLVLVVVLLVFLCLLLQFGCYRPASSRRRPPPP